MKEVKVIDIANDFSRFPAGRYRTDGHFSGERFRDDFLLPALASSDRVRVIFDGTFGYGSSFLEEAFGGLVRVGQNPDKLRKSLDLVSSDRSIIEEVMEYIAA